MSEQRTHTASWDETFMNIAEVVKQRSKDPVTQVGACIVSSDNRILSLGYNGAPNGFDDDDFPWGKVGEYSETKHAYVVHAERNAILNFRGSLREFEGSKLYVTYFPCNECAKEIAQVRIKEVVFCIEPNWNKDEYKSSKILLEKVGISFRKYTKHNA